MTKLRGNKRKLLLFILFGCLCASFPVVTVIRDSVIDSPTEVERRTTAVATNIQISPPLPTLTPALEHTDHIVRPNSGAHVVTDVLAVFKENYPPQNPKSMRLLSYVVENCLLAGDFKTLQQLESFRATASVDEKFLDGLDELVQPCSEISDYTPQNMTLSNWSRAWLEEAAVEGDPIARVEVLLYDSPSANNYSLARKALLEAGNGSSDYWLFYSVSNALTHFDDYVREDIYFINKTRWDYLGCVHDPACNQENMRSVLAEHYLPREVEEIVSFIDGIDDVPASIEAIFPANR